MSLDYNLDLATDLTPEEVAEEVSPTGPQPWHPPISALGTITPTAQILFELDKNHHVTEQQEDLIRLTAPLLERIPGDAVFSNLDVLWLIRKNGALHIHEDNDFWTPERLALLPQPYTRHSHRYE